jgi:hypothetical protein
MTLMARIRKWGRNPASAPIRGIREIRGSSPFCADFQKPATLTKYFGNKYTNVRIEVLGPDGPVAPWQFGEIGEALLPEQRRRLGGSLKVGFVHNLHNGRSVTNP